MEDSTNNSTTTTVLTALFLVLSKALKTVLWLELFLMLSDCDTVDRVGAAITAGANGSPVVRQFSVAFLAVDYL